MSIRIVAFELYRVMKQMAELERKLLSLPEGAFERAQIRDRLREAGALRDALKKMLEGAKGD